MGIAPLDCPCKNGLTLGGANGLAGWVDVGLLNAIIREIESVVFKHPYILTFFSCLLLYHIVFRLHLCFSPDPVALSIPAPIYIPRYRGSLDSLVANIAFIVGEGKPFNLRLLGGFGTWPTPQPPCIWGLSIALYRRVCYIVCHGS